MGRTNIWALGGHQTDFARNITREGGDFATLIKELIDHTLETSQVEVGDIDVIHVGNAFGELFAHQGHLGALPAAVEPHLVGIPASRHEAACASGSMALLAAVADLGAGHYDCALVLGVELEKSVPGDQAGAIMGSAAWAGHEGRDATHMWPYMFDLVRAEYVRRQDLDYEYLRAIAELNLRNARSNPLAQTRGWKPLDVLGPDGVDDTLNPFVEGGLRRTDCSQMTDGGAGIVLVSDAYLERQRGSARRRATRVKGWGHRTSTIDLQQKLALSEGGPFVMPALRQTVEQALAAACLTVDDIDTFEVHDCFSISEYAIIEHLGLTPPGESWKAVESGQLERDGKTPINPGGGLIGGGHPVGATGIRMFLDAHNHVQGVAGAIQIEGARNAMTVNFGGSMSTIASFVLGVDEP
ncbi:acetyl-CoA acetyltransferase [Rhodococcus sp. T7]|uniref:acetyl-CoA acetyltransferase n=1 Tax=Rhodococcus sp. T7 TaxID=627444 RepID=UPI0013589A1C|nr:acetyl-CoA acetyltransferase [Rhodococcus sp. T7]KAF0958003.1 Beta-ketoadipyl-CoA thiolase [Rhodococcus sp. T7]KAF0960162.1 Beta-ketoadipyl-CoA thiolase [Rhodococcus sp. T7]